jgi:uncharacterized protein (DUF924 family)
MSAIDFMTEWFCNNNLWFHSTIEDDDYIFNKYIHLLDIDIEKNIEPINKIIIYDQLPRHIFRNTDSNHIITYYLQKALDILKKTEQKYIDNLDVNKWCFMMLPYRHTFDLLLIINVIKMAWKKLYETYNENDILILKKFIKASYKRCPTDYQNSLISFYPADKSENINTIKNIFVNIIDKTQNNNNNNFDIEIWKELSLNFNIKTEINILSLSGGVDSMVCSTFTQPTVAVHINYCNHLLADEEEQFVRSWCLYMCIPLYVLKITEINRKSCMDNDTAWLGSKWKLFSYFNVQYGS